MAIERPDITVMGAGPVGLAAALALHDIANIRVLEAGQKLAARPAGDGIDLRVYALSPASRTLLESLGVWARIRESRVTPIRAMHIHGDAAPGELVLDARRPLAWMVEHDELVAALVEAADDAGIPLASGQRATCWQVPAGPTCESQLSLADGSLLRQTLIIGADGAQSWLRQAAGLTTHHKAYDSLGVVANFSCEHPHQGIARQWFKGKSVLAWLPLPGQVFSIVWSVSDAEGRRLQALDKSALADAVGQAGGFALGSLRVTSDVAVFPLRRTLAPVSVSDGLVLLGDAAHAIHPLAGQGVNLGFGDVASLRDVLAARGPLMRIGSATLLRRFERSRREDIAAMALLTDRLKSLFESDDKPLPALRNAGMAWLDRRQWLKHAIIRRAMG